MHIKHASEPVASSFLKGSQSDRKNFHVPLASRLATGWLSQEIHCPARPLTHNPYPHAPSLEPVAGVAAEAEADPVDVRPMGLECFPPRPGGFRPLGFCMVVPLSGWRRARAGHVLSAIVTHLWTENRSDHIITSP